MLPIRPSPVSSYHARTPTGQTFLVHSFMCRCRFRNNLCACRRSSATSRLPACAHLKVSPGSMAQLPKSNSNCGLFSNRSSMCWTKALPWGSFGSELCPVVIRDLSIPVKAHAWLIVASWVFDSHLDVSDLVLSKLYYNPSSYETGHVVHHEGHLEANLEVAQWSKQHWAAYSNRTLSPSRTARATENKCSSRVTPTFRKLYRWGLWEAFEVYPHLLQVGIPKLAPNEAHRAILDLNYIIPTIPLIGPALWIQDQQRTILQCASPHVLSSPWVEITASSAWNDKTWSCISFPLIGQARLFPNAYAETRILLIWKLSYGAESPPPAPFEPPQAQRYHSVLAVRSGTTTRLH